MNEAEVASMKRVLEQIKALCSEFDGKSLSGLKEPVVSEGAEEADVDPNAPEDTDEAKLLALKNGA
jgi:hypothetical protein